MGNIYIALGANLSNPKETFLAAIAALEDRGIAIKQLSGLWQSPSWPPGRGFPDYLNAAAEISYSGTPEQLLDLLMAAENELGRTRSSKNAPRTLDLDILDFKGVIKNHKSLTLPHPRMLDRGFVLLPLHQIAKDWIDPKSGQNIMEFIARLPLSDITPMKYVGTLR